MKFWRLFFIVILFLQLTPVYAQLTESQTPQNKEDKIEKEIFNMESESSSITWKPFTVEFNSTNDGYGLTMEKDFNYRLAARAGVSSDLKFLNLAYKVKMGVLYDLFDMKIFSFRLGLELGVKQGKKPLVFFDTRVTTALIDFPMLAQFTITDTFSINIGLISSLERDVGFAFNFSELNTLLFDSYHIGVRYRLTE